MKYGKKDYYCTYAVKAYRNYHYKFGQGLPVVLQEITQQEKKRKDNRLL